MFVTKNELINAGQLTRIKLKNALHGWMRNFMVIVGIISLANLIPALIGLFRKTDDINRFIWLDYSLLFSFGLVVAIVVLSYIYQSNQIFEVYPQTNTSRFLSTQILFHIWIVFAAFILLAVYLIQYGLISLISAVNKNIYMFYNFDIGFVIAGFFIWIIYMSIIIGIISLIAALMRKFRHLAEVFFSLAIVLAEVFFIMSMAIAMLYSDSYTMDRIIKVIFFDFLIFEHSIWIFILKGILLWAVLLITSLIVNKYTIYYHDSINIGNKLKTDRRMVVIAIASVSFGILVNFSGQSEEGWCGSSHQERYEAEVDISDLPVGSKINVVISGDIVTSEDEYSHEQLLYDGDKSLQPTIKGYDSASKKMANKLIVRYLYPSTSYNSKNISCSINPKLNIRLEGTTLYLDYTYDKNVKAVFMPMWSFMEQFDYFKGRDLFNEPFRLNYSYDKWEKDKGRIYIYWCE